MKEYRLILFIICLTVSACASKENISPLVGSWSLTAYGPITSTTPAVPDLDATLIFGEDGSLAGSTGCNELGRNYTVEGDQITFGQNVSTLILCPDLQMAQKEAMFQVLMETASFKTEENSLTITNNGMVLVLEAIARAT